MQADALIPSRLGNPVGGPEKAGVGGSIPSLATKLESITYVDGIGGHRPALIVRQLH